MSVALNLERIRLSCCRAAASVDWLLTFLCRETVATPHPQIVILSQRHVEWMDANAALRYVLGIRSQAGWIPPMDFLSLLKASLAS